MGKTTPLRNDMQKRMALPLRLKSDGLQIHQFDVDEKKYSIHYTAKG